MAVNMKPASADTVRAWAAEQGWTDQFGRAPKDRGRLNSELVADFDKAHKRNRIHYVPGYKDDNAGTPQQGNGGNARSTSRSTEVATRPAARSTAPARQTSPKATDEKATARRRSADDATPVRVQAERVSNDVASSMPVERINIEDAIALLSSAAAGRKKGEAPQGMLAYYVLV